MQNVIVTQLLTQPSGLATRLRGLRSDAGLTSQDLATALGWGPTKISKLEHGRQIPTEEDIRAWADACAVGPAIIEELVGLLTNVRSLHIGWRGRVGRAVQASYNELVAQSAEVTLVEVAVIPGLLQTPDYARYVLDEIMTMHLPADHDLEQAVRERMQRREALYEPKQFGFLVTEWVLRSRVCPATTMIGQLDRLLIASELPNVQLGIIPANRELSIIPQNSFGIYTTTDDEGVDQKVVIVDTFAGETIYDDGSAVNVHVDAAQRMWTDAATGTEATKLITEAIDVLRHENQPNSA